MPKSVAVDLHAFLDVVEAEREARSCSLVPVYRPGLEPVDWHLLSQHWPVGTGRGSAYAMPLQRKSADRVLTSRSRSPVPIRSRYVFGGLDTELMDSGCLEEWNWHFDGLVRPFRHGFVFAVHDALVDEDAERCRSVFVDAFGSNRVFRGDGILDQCLRRHRAGHRWEQLVHLLDSLPEVARAELSQGPVGALCLLSV